MIVHGVRYQDVQLFGMETPPATRMKWPWSNLAQARTSTCKIADVYVMHIATADADLVQAIAEGTSSRILESSWA